MNLFPHNVRHATLLTVARRTDRIERFCVPSQRPLFGVELVTAQYTCPSGHACEITPDILVSSGKSPSSSRLRHLSFFLASYGPCCPRYRLHHIRIRLYSAGVETRRGLDCSAPGNLAEWNSFIVAHISLFPLCFNRCIVLR